MATPATGLKTCTLKVNLFSGARTPWSEDTDTLLTLRDGNQHVVALPNNGFFTESSIAITGLPFFNNFGDRYAVIASADGYQQAGFFPVEVNPGIPAVVDLMLLKKEAAYNFHGASWKNLKQKYAALAAPLRAGAADDASAADRYGQLMEKKPAVLACYFNLAAAMAQVHLPVKTPLDYVRELMWGQLQQDRFFAWADAALIDQVAQAAVQGAFTPEVGTAIFHPGATRSWKQVQFGEANVQLTFHENDRKTIGGVECVKFEPDIDYFRDPLAHTILEVAVHNLTHSVTDPRQVYVLRWMAGRHAGVPNFEPPYTLE